MPESPSLAPPDLLSSPAFAAGAFAVDALAGPGVVRRGRDYARRGHVLDWRIAGDRLEARVVGNADEPYLVAVEWDGEELVPECDCPYDRELFCKHAVAALAAAVGGPLAAGPEVDDGEFVPPVLTKREEELSVRQKRGRSGDVRVRSLDRERYFGLFEVAFGDGRPYEVEIRSLLEPHNSCTCPDHAANLLGTCKHVEAVLHRHRKRAPKKTESLARLGPATSFVFVRRVDGPRIWLQRGRKVPPALARLLDRHFDETGAFTGDPVADFRAFREELGGRGGVVVCREAIELSERAGEDLASRRRREDVARSVLSARGRLPGFRGELYPYQSEGVSFLASSGRALLADDMGLGKTIQAIAACGYLREEEGVERVLVVCPASLKHQWEREFAKFAGVEAVVVGGGVPERNEQYRRRAPVTILNYELALRDGDRIRDLAPDVLVLDEAQRIKNWRTKTAQAIKAIESRFAFVLTGTPIENRLDDIYSLMQVVDARILGPLWTFNESFVRLDGRKVVGYRNLSLLRKLLKPVFLRRDRAEVLTQLPDRVDNRYYVEMTPAQTGLMDEHWQKALMILSRGETRPLTPEEERIAMSHFQRARMACDAAGLVDKETVGSPKLDDFARVLEEVCGDRRRKVVVFSEWETMIRMAEERADRLGIRHVRLSGSVPTQKRGAILDRFREDPDLLVFFSTDAGGVGLNLQVADTVVNLDLPWNPARLEQRIARVHRLGQKASVNVVLLVSEKSLEQRIEMLIEQKRELFDAVVAGEDGPDQVEIRSGMIRLLKELANAEAGADSDSAAAPASPEPAREEPPAPPPDPAEEIRRVLGWRLLALYRLASGRLAAVVDRRDETVEEAIGRVADAACRVLSAEEKEMLDRLGEDSPLTGADLLYEQEAGAATDRARADELGRVAARRLEAARRLADAGLGAEALGQAHQALLAAIRARLTPEEDATAPEDLSRAMWEKLVPDGRFSVQSAATASRVAELCRLYADRDLDVPPALLGPTIEAAAAAIA